MNVATLAFGCLAFLGLSGEAATAPQQITQADRDMAVRHLAETRQKFLASIAGLSQEQWAFKPGPDRWSIAEVAEHIAISESTILELITEKIMKAPAVSGHTARHTAQIQEVKSAAGYPSR